MEQVYDTTKKLVNFVSIKWKYLIAFSLLLVIVNFGLAWQASVSLKKQFEQYQNRHSEQSKQQLAGLLDSSYELLIQAAYTIQHASDINFLNSQHHDVESYRNHILDNHELQAVYLFSKYTVNQAVQSWELPPDYKKKLTQVFASELSLSGIFCYDQCTIYSLVPVLQDDRSTAVLFVSKSVAELMQNFFHVSATDIGLVNPETRQIYALSHSKQYSDLLHKALLEQPFTASRQQVAWNGKTYSLEYIDNADSGSSSQFVILSDITRGLQTIDQSTRNSMLYGTLGLLSSMLVILYLTAKPISRILFLSKHLPLLSSNQHDEFRAQYQRYKHDPILSDELDKLELTSIKLADQLQASEKDLIWQAEHDALTGLKNRHRFRKDFEQILNSAIRFKHEGALLYFDLDQFKYVNDTSGHKTGDMLIRLVADQIAKTIRNTDVFARLGGDEFALILSETDEQGAVKLAEKIQETLTEITLPAHDYVHRTSASIGVVMFPRHGNNVEELVANGDIAMYHAKDSGRGNIYLFTESDSTREHIHRRLRWKDEIEKALVDRRLKLHFQPILNIQSKKISHHEVLLRLQQENGEMAPPCNFIPEAEQSGLINSIDFYVMREAFIHLSEATNTLSKVAINLSGKTINDQNLVSYIKKLLSDYRIAPERIIFEVTETAAVADVVVASRIMKEINALGCHFALDDFGIGFSSFYYLKQLPVEYIKIDGAFIRNIVDSLDDQLFVQAITTVISGLGKKTVAEYVEDAAAMQLLQEFGVDYAQGYYIGKPQANPQTTFHN